MLKAIAVNIDDIYIPAERRKELDPERVGALAEEIMAGAEDEPIRVRQGKGRYVLIKGVNRLEARKSLGDTTILAYMVGARQF